MGGDYSTVLTDKDFNRLSSKCEHSDRNHVIDGVASQLRPAGWHRLLYYSNSWDSDAHFLLDGVYNGFRLIDPDASISTYACANYSSCDEDSIKLSDLLFGEIRSGKLSIVDKRPSCIHAMGVIPKSNGSIRPITDCKRPLKASVNNFTDSVFSRFSYVTIDNVLSSLERNMFMSVIDIKSAYRSVAIHPSNRTFFGLTWNFGDGHVYIQDNFMCFGARAAPFVFTRITDAISRRMCSMGFICYSYLDDFILLSKSIEDGCMAQRVLISILRDLGFYIAWNKISGPSQVCRFLGIDIDSISLQLKLPGDKLQRLRCELDFWSSRKYATKKQVQRLCGILNHCCKVIRGGRIFMHHMIKFLKCFKERKRLRLSKEFFDDIAWWKEFSSIFNGYADIIDVCNNTHEIFCDASLTGLGAVYDKHAIRGRFFPSVHDCVRYERNDEYYEVLVPQMFMANIKVLDLLAVYFALATWAGYMRNSRVIVNCDNLQVCLMLCKDRSHNELAAIIIRCIFWLCVAHNIYLSPSYIPT